ncbi:MAG: YigZ family protein [Gammaproteobacteria bacterium]|nr:MAG: YigZ family protein [Gammaproteobacteria bacterium]
MNKQPYLTLSQTVKNEIPAIKGSRFIALAFPVDGNETAMVRLSGIKTKYSDARHHCWAYRLCSQKKTRFADDGEPTGSAGKPILAPIVGRDLLDVMVVVIRYFGGVKLGVGGLVRAYSQATNDVLSLAEAQQVIVRIIPKITLQLIYSYNDTGHIAAALSSLAVSEKNSRYTDRVVSEIDVVPDQLIEVKRCLKNYTAGRIHIKSLNK